MNLFNQLDHAEEDDFPLLREEDIDQVLEDDGERPVDLEEDGMVPRLGDHVEASFGNLEQSAVYKGKPEQDITWNKVALHQNNRSVFTLSLHPKFPNPPLAITGGEDDLGYIFCPIPFSNSTDAQSFTSKTFLPIRLTGHTDSVTAAAWNFDGEMIATGGMDGRVRFWRRGRKRRGKPLDDSVLNTIEGWRAWEFITNLETGSEINWLKWHPKGNVLAAGCEDASVWLWNLPSGDTLAVLSSHSMSCTSGLFPLPAKHLLTASLDSSLILWDPRTSMPVWKTNIFLPPESPDTDPSIHGITCIALSPRGDVLAAGSCSGSVKIISLAKGGILATLNAHKEGDSVEALAFIDLSGGSAVSGGKGLMCISCGTDGRGFIWDVATGRNRHEIRHGGPITSLSCHPSPNNHLFTTASTDSTVKTWDVRTGTLLATHHGHHGAVNEVAVAPFEDGLAIISAGDEGACMAWKIEY
ncbi:hypothetical protein L204_105265 [Cryptococcus depauperatus]